MLVLHTYVVHYFNNENNENININFNNPDKCIASQQFQIFHDPDKIYLISKPFLARVSSRHSTLPYFRQQFLEHNPKIKFLTGPAADFRF